MTSLGALALTTLTLLLAASGAKSADFKVFWNAPSFMCKKYGVHLPISEYGAIQNTDDEFNGNNVTIFYEKPHYRQLGKYPHSPLKSKWVEHEMKMEADIDIVMPQSKHDGGISVIDWESWVPVWYQNPRKIRKHAKALISEKYGLPLSKEKWLRNRARAEFEHSASEFLERTIRLAAHRRGRRLWGYYAMPRCPAYHLESATCSGRVQRRNDPLAQLLKLSGAMYPAAYFPKDRTARENRAFFRIQAEEALRMQRIILKTGGPRIPIYMYVTFGYREIMLDGEMLLYSKEDLATSVQFARKLGLDGVVMWGSSMHFASAQHCDMMNDYMDSTLGPVMQEALFPEKNRRWRNSRAAPAQPWSEEQRTMPPLDALLLRHKHQRPHRPKDEFSMHYDPNEIPIPLEQDVAMEQGEAEMESLFGGDVDSSPEDDAHVDVDDAELFDVDDGDWLQR